VRHTVFPIREKYTVNVVNLGESRDLLQCWEQLKGLIAKGRSFALCVEGQDGEDSVFLAGRYRSDRASALKAAMRISWELTKAEEKPKALRVNQ
jgi:hypothetical protein